ncbi:general substrate transporter, partial [Aureobasidium melanogenum]
QNFKQYHANGNEQDSLVQSEYLEIHETLRAEKEFSSHGWKGMISNKGNRRRITLIALVSFFSQCSGNGLVSYYLHDILESVGMTDSYDQALFNGGLQIYNFLVAVLFSVLLVDKLGRRKLFLIAAGGMLVTFSIWTACSAVYNQTGNKGAGKAVLAMIFLFYGMAGFAWPGLTVAYSAEILPFNIRAKGMALLMAFQSLASVLNQYVNPIGLKSIAWKFYFVYIVILVIECIVIYMYFPETRGLTLEEVGHLLDDDEMSDVVQSRMEKVASIEVVHQEVVGEDKKV